MLEQQLGMIGAGSITHSHVPHWQSLGWEVSVYAHEGAEALARRYDLKVHATLEDLLASVTVVDVCTPSASHGQVALQAVRAGVHVVCEKPIALDFREALALAVEARTKGLTVLPAHVVRYFGEYAALHRAASSGVLGEPAILRFVRGGSRPTADWFLDESQSGGIVFDLMIHDLDQARWLAGEVRSIYAVQAPATTAGRVPSEVVAHATLVHDGGAISQVQAYWGRPGLSFGPSFDVAGSCGRLVSSPADAVTVFEDLPGQQPEQTYLPPETAEESPFLSQIKEFASVLQSGGAGRVSLMDGVMAVALAEAARESIRTRHPVDLAPWRELVEEVA